MVEQYKDKYPDGVSLNLWRYLIISQVKRIRGYRCEKCNTKDNVDVHHLDYDNVNINTLRLACRSCHKKIHSGKLEDFK